MKRRGKKLEENFIKGRWWKGVPDSRMVTGREIGKSNNVPVIMDASGKLRVEHWDAYHMCVCEIQTS
jgi:hypothetical protein